MTVLQAPTSGGLREAVDDALSGSVTLNAEEIDVVRNYICLNADNEAWYLNQGSCMAEENAYSLYLAANLLEKVGGYKRVVESLREELGRARREDRIEVGPGEFDLTRFDT